jgi:hypothetical protein
MIAARLDLDVIQVFTEPPPERRFDMGLDRIFYACWLDDNLVGDSGDAS